MINDYEPPPSYDEMIVDIVEYNINNMSWADIKQTLEEAMTHKFKQYPPEALELMHDSIFNR